MEQPNSTKIAIADIEIGDRLRPARQDYVGVLAHSIENMGLLSPILVRGQLRGPRKYRLVSGLHRLAACTSLGWDRIPAIVVEGDDLNALLVEIDENVARHDLTALDRAVALARRKAIYEELYPETKHGVAGALAKHGSANDKLSFADDVADRVGLSKRSIQRSIAIVQMLDKGVRERLAGTSIADNASALQQLAKVPSAQQQKVVDRLLDAESPAGSVADALQQVEGRKAPPKNELEVKLARFRTDWNRAGRKYQDAVLDWLLEHEGEALLDRINERLGGPA